MSGGCNVEQRSVLGILLCFYRYLFFYESLVTVLPKLQYCRATSNCFCWAIGMANGPWPGLVREVAPQSSEQLAVDKHLCSLRVPWDRERRGGSGRTRPKPGAGHAVVCTLHTPFIYSQANPPPLSIQFLQFGRYRLTPRCKRGPSHKYFEYKQFKYLHYQY